MSNKLYVGNLPFRTNEAEIRDAFGQFGELTEVILIKDRETGNLKGFGFVSFKSSDAANAALSMNGQDFHGRALRVNLAQAKEEGGRRDGGRDRY